MSTHTERPLNQEIHDVRVELERLSDALNDIQYLINLMQYRPPRPSLWKKFRDWVRAITYRM